MQPLQVNPKFGYLRKIQRGSSTKSGSEGKNGVAGSEHSVCAGCLFAKVSRDSDGLSLIMHTGRMGTGRVCSSRAKKLDCVSQQAHPA